MRTGFLVFVLVLIAPLARAGCDDQLEKLNHEFGYPEGSPAYIACKAWPINPAKMIVVFAHKALDSRFSQDKADAESVYDLNVMVQASDSGEILLRLTEKAALTSDAFTLQDVSVDGARLLLAKGSPAFGIRSRRSNRVAEIESLSLYAVVNNKIIQVLAPVHTTLSFCESPDDRQCARTSKTTAALSLAKTSSNGWADLIVTERKVIEEFGTDGLPIAKPVGSSRKFRLRFDGQNYVIPKALAANQY